MENSPLQPKKAVFFSMENILTPGPLSQSDSIAPAKRLLEGLTDLAGQGLEFHLLTGLLADDAASDIRRQGLDAFFDPSRIHWPDEAYLATKTDVEKRMNETRRENNPRFVDDYFKQVAIQKVLAERRFEPAHIVLVGHDLLTHGYYSTLFSQAPVVFVKSLFSFNDAPLERLVPGLAFSSLEPADLRPYLNGKKDASDPRVIKAVATERLRKELLGDSLQKAMRAPDKQKSHDAEEQP